MAKEDKKDDLEAVRILVDALAPFDNTERDRIIRWASEKLGLTSMSGLQPILSKDKTVVGSEIPRSSASDTSRKTVKDIKSFIDEKDPQNDQQLAAVVAYYYAFEVGEDQRKNYIGSDEIIDACRLAQRRRPKKPIQTLINAAYSGFLDKADETGMYRINAVGENLVAMTLPGSLPAKRKISKIASKPKKIVKKKTAVKKK
ncbi:MAG: hypothetical protein P4L63_03300 [Candidatus Pacebacteria bacterium]|nr:hypothetical protein [Candidatus Paceibacterota bacterium]